jgi:hypothetical protein
MDKLQEIDIEISAGKKSFKIEEENSGYNLFESGSLVARLKQTENGWEFTTGSYTKDDAEKVGKAISNIQ